MSTKAIHEALDRFRDLMMDVGAPPDGEDMECLLRARDEMNSIERAAKVLHADAATIYSETDDAAESVEAAAELLWSIAQEAP